MIRVLYLTAVAVALGFLLRAYAFERIVVVSGSMEPTLPVGKTVLVNKFIYRLRPPRHGEIVTFPSPVENRELVKRIIAMEGDEVKIVEKQVQLNGRPLPEPYVQHTRAGENLVGDNMELGVVPAGHVVVMGDNRDESGDSRDWLGPTGGHIPFVAVKTIEGKLMVDR
ncbi:MAG: signal peptidase I [Elusimicrobia bacterium]|nr:signal peptidase I [Elusimicrobiota bacterium]